MDYSLVERSILSSLNTGIDAAHDVIEQLRGAAINQETTVDELKDARVDVLMLMSVLTSRSFIVGTLIDDLKRVQETIDGRIKNRK